MSLRSITVAEHQSLPVGERGARSLTPGEAETLERLNEQRRGFCQRGYRSVSFAQYCGVVSIGDRVLEILPKVHDDDAVEDCRTLLLDLLVLSQRFAAFKHLTASQRLQRAPLLEVFIAAFLESVRDIVRGGLTRQYREAEDDLEVIRGRILTNRQFTRFARRNDVAACAFDELTADNLWNRLLKSGLRAVRSWIVSTDLQRRWVELMMVFDEVSEIPLDRNVFRYLVFDRHGWRYREAIDWVRWISAALSPALRAGDEDAPGLLFDMNRLFESATASVLRRRVPAGTEVVAQDRDLHLARLTGERRKDFALRPDLILRKGSELAIGDTKWKRVAVAGDGYLQPAEDDVYQMLAYAAAYRCEDLSLLYPWHGGLTGSRETTFELPRMGDIQPRLTVVCVDWKNREFIARRGGGSSRFGELLAGG